MTKAEYEAWKKETERSRHHWTVDEVRKINTGDLLFYKGAENGQYIEVSFSGVATVGTYEGAIPHIGEALFRPLHSRSFSSQGEALKVLLERAGLNFLMDFMGF